MLSCRMPVAINRYSREHGVLSGRVPDSIHYTGFHEKRSTGKEYSVIVTGGSISALSKTRARLVTGGKHMKRGCSLPVCMCVYMIIRYIRVWINRVRSPILLVIS